MQDAPVRDRLLTDDAARAVLIAWANSGGFAAVHNAGATDAQIVDDLLAYLDRRGFLIISRDREPFDWGAIQKLRKTSP